MVEVAVGLISKSNLRRWTPSAIRCYEIGCMCSKCDLPKEFKPRCRMKASVLELVKKLGVPVKKVLQKERVNSDDKIERKFE